MLKVISFLGQKRNGKDHVSKLFIEELFIQMDYSIFTIAFADKLKEALSVMTGIPLEKFYDSNFKDGYMIDLKTLDYYPVDHQKIKTGECMLIRYLLQYFGTNIVQKEFGKRFWIASTLKSLKEESINIITDVRFKEEFKAVKSIDGITIRIINPNIVSYDTHPSENETTDLPTDYTIINDCIPGGKDNTDDLIKQIKTIVSEIKKEYEWKISEMSKIS